MFKSTMFCHVDGFDSIELVIFGLLQIWECARVWSSPGFDADRDDYGRWQAWLPILPWQLQQSVHRHAMERPKSTSQEHLLYSVHFNPLSMSLFQPLQLMQINFSGLCKPLGGLMYIPQCWLLSSFSFFITLVFGYLRTFFLFFSFFNTICKNLHT